MIENITFFKCDKCGELIDKKEFNSTKFFYDVRGEDGSFNRIEIPFAIKRDHQDLAEASLCRNCKIEIIKKLLKVLEE